MGGCLSSKSSINVDQKPSANVVSINGELRQFSLPITVSQVLQSLSLSSTPEMKESFFLCNSDRLYFDDYIPSLDPHHQLEPSQIYFMLPTAKLQYRLAASDMAALAVKASVALHQINVNNSNRRRKSKTRISPVMVSEEDPQSNHTVNYRKSFVDNDIGSKSSSAAAAAAAGLGVSRSGSVRKLTRYSSRRAKLAVRSFKIKLSTIYEGSVLHPSF